MKRHAIITLASVAVVVMALPLWAQETPAKPGPEHAALAQQEGTWDATLKAAGQADSKGVMTVKMDVGGLFLISDFKTDDGFTGHGVSGYDPHAKKYTGIWVDNMSASIMRLEGTFDKGNKTLSETGEVTGHDGKPVKFKMVTEFKDKDMHVFKLSMLGADGKEEPMLTIEYRRRK